MRTSLIIDTSFLDSQVTSSPPTIVPGGLVARIRLRGEDPLHKHRSFQFQSRVRILCYSHQHDHLFSRQHRLCLFVCLYFRYEPSKILNYKSKTLSVGRDKTDYMVRGVGGGMCLAGRGGGGRHGMAWPAHRHFRGSLLYLHFYRIYLSPSDHRRSR